MNDKFELSSETRNDGNDIEEEKGIDIKLFGKYYMGSSRHEYFIYYIQKEHKTKISHYSTINSLFDNLPDRFLKLESRAKTFKELKDDLTKIYRIIEDIKIELKLVS